ncbi:MULTISPECIES: carbohydrate ABC transporter permease [unclassified Pseudactinotalea]|uniref:carbohydrate ABC transporter permease n=1 Tax=Micrococcales TaxID=85006 RepID=UPI003C7A195A
MRSARKWTGGIVAIVASLIIFLVPFVFVILQAMKTPAEASRLEFSWPEQMAFVENLIEVLTMRNGVVLRAFVNSTIITVAAVTLMVIVSAMVGYVLQRRVSKINPVVNFFVLAGLIVPPAVVPTVWLLQALGLFRTMPGLVLVQATFGISFCILLFRAFVGTIPRELDEAAVIDGSGPVRLFFTVILPLMKPTVITVIVVQAVNVFNDFVNPLYFLPGERNATVQLTLFNLMQQQAATQWNLLFANTLLITIPPLVMYIFFNRQIVAGMTSGAVKG